MFCSHIYVTTDTLPNICYHPVPHQGPSTLGVMFLAFQMHHMSIWHSKEKKSAVNHKIVKIGQQMWIFERELNVETRTFLKIFIFSVLSIKITLSMHETCLMN